MNEWHKLTSSPGVRAADSGPDLQFNVVVSPYDVPEAVRGRRTSEGGLVIEFRYIDGEEPSKEVRLDDNIVVLEGKHSKRLLAIKVDVRALGAESVGLAINTPEALKQELETAWKRLRTEHPDAGKNSERVRQIFSPAESDVLSSAIGS